MTSSSSVVVNGAATPIDLDALDVEADGVEHDLLDRRHRGEIGDDRPSDLAVGGVVGDADGVVSDVEVVVADLREQLVAGAGQVVVGAGAPIRRRVGRLRRLRRVRDASGSRFARLRFARLRLARRRRRGGIGGLDGATRLGRDGVHVGVRARRGERGGQHQRHAAEGARSPTGPRTHGGRAYKRPAPLHRRPRPPPSAVEVGVLDAGAVADGVDRGAGQDAAAGQQPAALPVGEAELGRRQGVLAVDPAGEAVADERGVDGVVEAVVLGRGPRSPARPRTAGCGRCTTGRPRRPSRRPPPTPPASAPTPTPGRGRRRRALWRTARRGRRRRASPTPSRGSSGRGTHPASRSRRAGELDVIRRRPASARASRNTPTGPAVTTAGSTR